MSSATSTTKATAAANSNINSSTKNDTIDDNDNDDNKNLKDQNDPSESEPEKPNLTLWTFLDRNQPWVLVKGGSFLNFFDFVPSHYRHGPWSMTALLGFPTMIYLLLMGAIWVDQQKPAGGWWPDSALQHQQSYQAFTWEWYYTLAAFGWMSYLCWNVYFKSPLGGAAWISFTLWSWTTMTIRHCLCVMAPFVGNSSTLPVRRIAEILRFPSLLSASITFILWNFVLFPVILIFFIREYSERRKFFGYMTNFRLTQLHVFNIWFAISNNALIHPLRTLHLGDLVAAGTMMVIYMFWYYFVLDRVGIHLYPIFTPRSSFVVLGWMLIVAICLGGYFFWKDVLQILVDYNDTTTAVAGTNGDDNSEGVCNMANNLTYMLQYLWKQHF